MLYHNQRPNCISIKYLPHFPNFILKLTLEVILVSKTFSNVLQINRKRCLKSNDLFFCSLCETKVEGFHSFHTNRELKESIINSNYFCRFIELSNKDSNQ